MARWPIPAPTSAAQRRASAPGRSAWVRANAGSGKTHVLAQRVVRLLLQGADPSKILCLTFTKAAAANMSLRIFSILSRWTRLGDEELLKELRAFGMRFDPQPDVARRLFARAVETPGGLKIQTIHAFCERILHLFPFEANVPASFEAVDDERQAAMMEEARAETLREAALHRESDLARALEIVAAETTSFTFEALLDEALGKRQAVAHASRLQGEGFAHQLSGWLGLKQGENEESIGHDILYGGIDADQWQTIVSALDRSGANDVKLANCYRLVLSSPTIEGKLQAYRKLFYDSKGQPKNPKSGWLVNKSVGNAINEQLGVERDRVAPLYEKLKSCQTVKRSVALHRLCDSVLDNYTRRKHAQGLLDFDDLIERTWKLLERSDAGWILYKLDAGIDHILLDEAQDTSPRQWEIIQRLVEEFYSGASARSNLRTLFAVGDEKQSIFSFQGAAPAEFGENAKRFAKKFTDAEQRFADVTLTVSFRSSQTILKSVDDVFSIEAHYEGLSADPVKTVHQAWKHDIPGLVEIWDPCTGEKRAEPEDWEIPLDAIRDSDPVAVLAQRIAQKIAALLNRNNREAVHDNDGQKRAVRAGDIMILVRRRNAFFDAIIRALKLANVPVAGADRLKLMDHIAVMDLVAAGRAALLPQDDLTLACVLKSPLFDYDDCDLIRLAPHRKGPLFAELLRSDMAKDRAAAERIIAWGRDARSLGPYRFYAKILGAGGGRKQILGRLGAEAGDAIDEFMRLALDRERMEAISLTGFLQAMQNADIEVKRDMEAAGESVRVMTVHAAKGLEAKIVFLPDTIAKPSGQHDPKLIEVDADGNGECVPVWRRRTKDDPEAVNAALDRLRREEEYEYRRLLYVALTRAEERLYISGYHGEREPQAGCWYNMIRNSLDGFASEVEAPWGEGSVRRIGTQALLDIVAEGDVPPPPPALPGWLLSEAPQEAAPAPPLRPSQALAAADQIEPLGGASSPRRLAMLEGTLAHALLQHLPGVDQTQRADVAARFMAARGGEIEAARRDALVRDVLALMDDSDLAPLFTAKARAEAAIAGRVELGDGGTVEITGRIDRLAETERDVLIADFKTGAPAQGKIPAAYLAQMALYRAALQPLFPGKPVRALLIWTEGPKAVELPADALDEALAAVTSKGNKGNTSS